MKKLFYLGLMAVLSVTLVAQARWFNWWGWGHHDDRHVTEQEAVAFDHGKDFGSCMKNCRNHHRKLNWGHGEGHGKCWEICDREFGD